MLQILLVWWRIPLRLVEVVALCGRSWGSLVEVWMGGRGDFGLGFGAGTVCGREPYKGLVGVIFVRRMVFVGGDLF